MQLIAEKETGAVVYAFPDEAYIEIGENSTWTPASIIGDMNRETAVLVRNAPELPADFEPRKYLWRDSGYVLNPNWTEGRDA